MSCTSITLVFIVSPWSASSSSRACARSILVGGLSCSYLLPSPHPPVMQKIVNGHVDETRICAVEETLNQPNEKAAPGEPFESRQDLLEERSHVHARRRQQAV